MDTFEIRHIIVGQIAHTLKCSGYNASMQPPVSLTFIQSPVIMPYISNTVSWNNIIPGIVDQFGTVNDLILFIGHCDLHLIVQ